MQRDAREQHKQHLRLHSEPESMCERTLQGETLRGEGKCVTNHCCSHARGLGASLPQRSSILVVFLFIYSFLILEGFSQGLQWGWGSPCAGAQDRMRQKKAVPIARCPGSQCGCFLQGTDNFFVKFTSETAALEADWQLHGVQRQSDVAKLSSRYD